MAQLIKHLSRLFHFVRPAVSSYESVFNIEKDLKTHCAEELTAINKATETPEWSHSMAERIERTLKVSTKLAQQMSQSSFMVSAHHAQSLVSFELENYINKGIIDIPSEGEHTFNKNPYIQKHFTYNQETQNLREYAFNQNTFYLFNLPETATPQNIKQYLNTILTANQLKLTIEEVTISKCLLGLPAFAKVTFKMNQAAQKNVVYLKLLIPESSDRQIFMKIIMDEDEINLNNRRLVVEITNANLNDLLLHASKFGRVTNIDFPLKVVKAPGVAHIKQFYKDYEGLVRINHISKEGNITSEYFPEKKIPQGNEFNLEMNVIEKIQALNRQYDRRMQFAQNIDVREGFENTISLEHNGYCVLTFSIPEEAKCFYFANAYHYKIHLRGRKEGFQFDRSFKQEILRKIDNDYLKKTKVKSDFQNDRKKSLNTFDVKHRNRFYRIAKHYLKKRSYAKGLNLRVYQKARRYVAAIKRLRRSRRFGNRLSFEELTEKQMYGKVLNPKFQRTSTGLQVEKRIIIPNENRIIRIRYGKGKALKMTKIYAKIRSDIKAKAKNEANARIRAKYEQYRLIKDGFKPPPTLQDKQKEILLKAEALLVSEDRRAKEIFMENIVTELVDDPNAKETVQQAIDMMKLEIDNNQTRTQPNRTAVERCVVEQSRGRVKTTSEMKEEKTQKKIIGKQTQKKSPVKKRLQSKASSTTQGKTKKISKNGSKQKSKKLEIFRNIKRHSIFLPNVKSTESLSEQIPLLKKLMLSKTGKQPPLAALESLRRNSISPKLIPLPTLQKQTGEDKSTEAHEDDQALAVQKQNQLNQASKVRGMLNPFRSSQSALSRAEKAKIIIQRINKWKKNKQIQAEESVQTEESKKKPKKKVKKSKINNQATNKLKTPTPSKPIKFKFSSVASKSTFRKRTESERSLYLRKYNQFIRNTINEYLGIFKQASIESMMAPDMGTFINPQNLVTSDGVSFLEENELETILQCHRCSKEAQKLLDNYHNLKQIVLSRQITIPELRHKSINNELEMTQYYGDFGIVEQSYQVKNKIENLEREVQRLNATEANVGEEYRIESKEGKDYIVKIKKIEHICPLDKMHAISEFINGVEISQELSALLDKHIDYILSTGNIPEQIKVAFGIEGNANLDDVFMEGYTKHSLGKKDFEKFLKLQSYSEEQISQDIFLQLEVEKLRVRMREASQEDFAKDTSTIQTKNKEGFFQVSKYKQM